MLKLFAGARPGPTIVSCLVVVGFILVVTVLLVRPIALDDHSSSILTLLVGALANEFGHVVQFHIGSSTGSKAKDDILHQLAAAGGDDKTVAGG